MVRESIYQKFLEEIEDYIVPGYPPEGMHTMDQLNDEIMEVVERFQEAHGYSERTFEAMLDDIYVRDAIVHELKECGYTFDEDDNDLKEERLEE